MLPENSAENPSLRRGACLRVAAARTSSSKFDLFELAAEYGLEFVELRCIQGGSTKGPVIWNKSPPAGVIVSMEC